MENDYSSESSISESSMSSSSSTISSSSSESDAIARGGVGDFGGRSEMSAGHGGSSGRYDQYREVAMRQAFLLMLAGIKEGVGIESRARGK